MSECDDEKEARRDIYGILTHSRTRKIGPVVRLPPGSRSPNYTRYVGARSLRFKGHKRYAEISIKYTFFPRHRFIYFLAILGMATFIDIERELSTDLLETLAAGLVMGTWRKGRMS